VVHFNDEGLFCLDEVGTSVIDQLHDSKEFQVVSVIVLLCWGEGCQIEGNRVPSLGCGHFLSFVL